MIRAGESYTTEYRYEFESNTARLLRRRFLWFTGVFGALSVLSISASLIAILAGGQAFREAVADQMGPYPSLQVVLSLLSMGLYVGGFLYALSNRAKGFPALRLSYLIVTADGILNLIARTLDAPWPVGLGWFVLVYTTASAILPWTVRQALVPAVIVLAVNAVLRLTPLDGGFSMGRVLGVAVSCLLVVPGVLLAWWRHSTRVKQFQFSFMQQRYGEVRRELTDARRIHESMFPAPKTDGDVRFTYRYQPMRQIGGDYLHIAVSPTDCGTDERLCVVVLDVTGHGIPAALNVNRLYGELARIFAEDPCIHPGDVLKLLNRYVRLTMSSHSVYVTGLAVRVDPVRGVLEYSNAGHPPAFHMGVDGTIDQLDSTTYLLGAVGDADFDPHTREVPFDRGDRLIAYTDGATEAANETGRMLGIRGMQGVLASQRVQTEGGWPMTLLSAVDEHRDGPPKDDTLVIEIFRPMTGGGERKADVAARKANDDSRVPVG